MEAGGRIGHFEVVARLGKGGMAEVFRARVLEGPRKSWQVALKRLLPELVQDAEAVAAFTREADLSLVLQHPNVVRTLEVGEADGIAFLVMEYVDGRDLGQILRRCRQRRVPLPVDFGVFLAKALLDALAYAHTVTRPDGETLGLVHCDVSPSNLFISRTGEIKLGDFGVSRARIDSTSAAPVTGKAYYLSPEVLEGAIGPAADLWAANVVLYEVLTLERPFVGANPEEVFAAVRARAFRPVRDLRPEISPALAAIVDRGFARRLDDRFLSAAQMSGALQTHYDERVGTPLAIAAVVRGLFGTDE